MACAMASERDVVVRNTSAAINLAGSLAVPDSGQPTAFFVLASGSGAQNRDEEVMGQKPFKVLSDTLVAHGYGVLRMDDRGVGESDGVFADAVLDDFTSDALAGVEFIRKSYPGAKVGILGHSQGGQVAVKAASRGLVDFIVTLAGPAWPGDSLVMSQARAIAVAATGSWPNEQLQRRLLDVAMSGMPTSVMRTVLYSTVAEAAGDAISFPHVQQQIMAQIEPILTPMYRDLLLYDPTDDIKAVDVPWIALNGDKDLQVMVGNLDTIRHLNPRAVTIVVPGHNHLFQPAITGLMDEYPTAGRAPSDTTLSLLIDALKGIDLP